MPALGTRLALEWLVGGWWHHGLAVRRVRFWLLRAVPILIVVGAGVLAWRNAARYLPFFADDAFISLRYSERLLSGHGLTWTDGERVEGYSNLLWVLGCAALGAFGFDLVTAARLLGFASILGMLGCIAWHLRPRQSLSEALPGFVACAAVAASNALAVWSVGGLEQPLLALLVTAGYLVTFRVLDGGPLVARDSCLAGLLLGLACITRPDGLLWVVPPVLAVAFVLRGREGLLGALRLGACAAALPAAQLVFRLGYYGDWVPNTARAKVALTPERLKSGTEYINGALAAALPLVAAGCVALGVSLGDRTARPRILLLGSAVGAWLSYVRLIGGDIFPAYRHVTVVVPLVALAIGEALRVLQGSQRKLAIVAALVTLLAVSSYHRLERANPELKRATIERWEWDAEVVGPFLLRHFGERGALLAVEAAGALPYFAKLPALDLLGLNDRHLARDRPRDFGKGFIGHELGNGRYVRERSPDLMVFQTPTGNREPAYKSGRDLVGTPWFRDEYELVRFGIGAHKLEALVWVRKRGRAVDPGGNEASVRIPALLFGAGGERTVSEDSSGELVVTANPGAPARASGIEVERGTYAVEPRASGTPSAVRVTGGEAGALETTGDGFTCSQKRCLVDVTLEPAAGATRVYGVDLRRVPATPRSPGVAATTP